MQRPKATEATELQIADRRHGAGDGYNAHRNINEAGD